MIEIRWATPAGTTTKPPVLQFRMMLAVDASGAFCPGPAGEWKDVPISVVPAPVFDWKPTDPGCWCARCDMEHNVTRTRMSVCDKCGDKRCPRAGDHRDECRMTPNVADNRIDPAR